MWALPQRYEKATAAVTLPLQVYKVKNIFLRKIKKFSGSGHGSGSDSVTVTVAVMLRLFPYNVAVAFLLRYGCVSKILALA